MSRVWLIIRYFDGISPYYSNIYRHHCNIDSNVIMKVALGHVSRRIDKTAY